MIDHITAAILQREAAVARATDRLAPAQIWLVRHGETDWSLTGQHTGNTDLPLTARGERQAREIGELLRGRHFGIVLTSALLRARETCRLAGYGNNAVVDPDLREWDYGNSEGKTTAEIQVERPGWALWTDGVPGGESIEQVATRAQAVVNRVLAGFGDALLFGHGHILRILACRCLGLPPQNGRLFALATAALTTLDYEHETRVITRLNGGLLW